ncbi:hypothetical protein EJ05DRAFT_42684 [Pseudovirgaria hyperparasitica]|uniref:SnoaL-like domain-containing protein n=1 Tax=Pseudovirgaria hyperparasitica TaxID=470096 RepID=A0A6A6WN33_9PEZI|nr:uncharacterized protein EJ05DRAFT_42684 [Pseudovirgaria hyperparasitica]KAF2763543.1 hypothetical protein EJ05DRAFT_42684 [Pseudovirgaria hyperparasitica]
MAPSRPDIELIFNHLASAQYEQFFEHVAENVQWTVMGTHPLSGLYASRTAFVDGTIKRLNAIFKEPIQLKVRNVIGGDDQEWSVTELAADAVCKNGMDFKNRYAWVCRWEGDSIVEVRAYLDSELVKRALETNEN